MLADGFLRLARQGNGMQRFLRYQAQAERLYRRAVKEFERVSKLRPELSNEPFPLRATPPNHQKTQLVAPSIWSPVPRPTNPFLPRLFAQVMQALPPANCLLLVGQALPPAKLVPPTPRPDTAGDLAAGALKNPSRSTPDR